MFFRFILAAISLFYFSTTIKAAQGLSPDPAHKNEKLIDIQTTLPKVTFGKPEAPLKIIMFHSLSCGHCKEFKEKTFPQVKEQFINKGLVYFMMVDFPTNPQALNAAKVAWESRDVESYEKISEALVAEDEMWGKPADTSDQICKVLMEKHLMTEIECQQGLNDEMLGKEILRPVFELGKNHQIDYAPAFLFNGELKENPSTLTIPDIENELEKLQVNIKNK